MARRHICDALNLPPEAVRVDLRTEASMLPAVAQALQARQQAMRAAETAARATFAALEALVADGSTFQEAAIVLGLSPEEITEFTSRLQARGSRQRTTPTGPGGPGIPHGPSAPHGPAASGTSSVPGGSAAPAGPRARGDTGASNGPPTGPTGLPQRTRSSGGQPVHP